MAVKAERGKFLTIMIVLGVLGWLMNLPQILNISQTYNALGIALPQWYMPYLLIVGIMQMVSFVGIWYWKKWAVYGLFTLSGVSLIINIFTLNPIINDSFMSPFMNFAYILGVLGIGLWFWAIYRKWQYFK